MEKKTYQYRDTYGRYVCKDMTKKELYIFKFKNPLADIKQVSEEWRDFIHPQSKHKED